MKTISESSFEWLEAVSSSKSRKTFETYRSAWIFFSWVLREHDLDPDKSNIDDLTETAFIWLVAKLKSLSVATEKLRLTAIKRFYKFLIADGRTNINMERIDSILEQRTRRPGIRYPEFNQDGIEKVLEGMDKMQLPKDGTQRLRDLRDKALIITLADTGMRIHEACKLTRGDIDWNEGKAMIIGKGNKQGLIRFTKRSLNAMKSYLSARSVSDGASGRPLSSLPIFTRHDQGAGRKIPSITPVTGRAIVEARVTQILGEQEGRKITPHSFRHYFVTMILFRSGGNLKKAQELARHANIQTTQAYAHLSDEELDKTYYDVFERGSK